MTDLPFMSATELVRALRAKEISSTEATQGYLAQIEKVNPKINAVVTLVADQALADAKAADEYAAKNDDLPPLHGVPMLHKDTHTTGGIRTTHGSPLFAQNIPAADDLVIARLHKAGVVTMGKTNTPEFAAGSHTFNEVFGKTLNPYDVTKSAGGSSGGAAAALATGMTPIADGSDMGGSLRNPASFCNVVGIRPTPGRVPQAPDNFAQFTLATAGPMARSVDDVALLLSVMAGPDPIASNALDRPGSDFAAVAPIEVTGLRVAVAPDFGGTLPVQPEVADVVRKAGETFESLGATVEFAMPDLTHADDVLNIRRAMQFVTNLGPHVDAHPDMVKETIKWNVAKGRDLTIAELAQSLQWGEEIFARVAEFFTKYDVLIAPVSQVMPFDGELEYPTEINGQPMENYLQWMRGCSDITATFTPAMSVPGGFSSTGLPIGIQLVAPSREDARLLSIAKVFEQATQFAQTRPGVLN